MGLSGGTQAILKGGEVPACRVPHNNKQRDKNRLFILLLNFLHFHYIVSTFLNFLTIWSCETQKIWTQSSIAHQGSGMKIRL